MSLALVQLPCFIQTRGTFTEVAALGAQSRLPKPCVSRQGLIGVGLPEVARQQGATRKAQLTLVACKGGITVSSFEVVLLQVKLVLVG